LQEDDVLTAYTGNLTGGAGDFSFRWYRVNEAGGRTFLHADSTHTVTAEDNDFQIVVTVTRGGATGSGSSPTGAWVVDTAAPELGGNIAISGVPTDLNTVLTLPGAERTLSAPTTNVTPAVRPEVPFSFQWFHVNQAGTQMPIPGATGSTHIITHDDNWRNIFVRVTRRGNNGYVDSNQITIPVLPLPLPTGTVFIASENPTIWAINYRTWNQENRSSITAQIPGMTPVSHPIGSIIGSQFTGSLPVMNEGEELERGFESFNCGQWEF